MFLTSFSLSTRSKFSFFFRLSPFCKQFSEQNMSRAHQFSELPRYKWRNESFGAVRAQQQQQNKQNNTSKIQNKRKKEIERNTTVNVQPKQTKRGKKWGHWKNLRMDCKWSPNGVRRCDLRAAAVVWHVLRFLSRKQARLRRATQVLETYGNVVLSSGNGGLLGYS